jgi:hypothetical protein
MRSVFVAAIVTLVLASPGAAALPQGGLLVPGRSLGGLRLGATPADVTASWGRSHSVCRGCSSRTWYFNYRPFAPQGAAAEFRAHRVAALYTLWSPPGWRTSKGLRLGDDAARVTALYGALLRTDCSGYYALAIRSARSVTAFYVVGAKLWAFALLLPSVPICR